jgi:peptidylprolyl isomerase
MAKARIGDKVRVHYTGKLKDGEVFDSSKKQEPLEFTLGSQKLIRGFEKCVQGMEVKEKKSVTVPAEEAYGVHRDDLVMDIPLEQFPQGVVPEEGHFLQIKNHEGQAMRFLITAIKEDSVTVDANHPLAGQELTFDIELVEIVQ